MYIRILARSYKYRYFDAKIRDLFLGATNSNTANTDSDSDLFLLQSRWLLCDDYFDTEPATIPKCLQ